MSGWKKVPHSGKGTAPPHWLQIRKGTHKTSYRVRHRRDGLDIEHVLEGDFDTWQDAREAGDALIFEKKFGAVPKPKNLVLCDTLCDEIVALKKSKDPSTYEQAEIFFRRHLKPFLQESCPYAADLNATVWLKYRNEFRLKHPESPLFNHWKFFVQLFKMANEKGIIPKFKLEYSEKKDDNRAIGMVIPTDRLQAFLKEANRAWTDRTIIQRLTGQRPSVIRRLKKDFIDFERRVAKIPKEESKNRRTYEFKIPKVALASLQERMGNGSPYFFPSERDKDKPMDKHLGGWNAAWRRAGFAGLYTPHDIRHTFLTEKVATAGTNLAVLCYSCDLSLEEMMRTYVHFKAEDTQALADDSDSRAAALFGGAQ